MVRLQRFVFLVLLERDEAWSEVLFAVVEGNNDNATYVSYVVPYTFNL